MGIFEKAVAYRWVTRGRDGGGGGAGGLGVVLLLFLAIGLVIYGIHAVVTAVTSAIYHTIRPVLLFAPHLNTLLVGVILVGIVNLVVEYPPGEATKILSSADDSLSFYARAVGITLLLNVLVFAFGTGLFDPAGDEMHPLVQFGWAVSLLYLTYKYLQVLFQTHRLVRCAPYGRFYSTAVLLPITTGLTISIFDVPTNYPDSGLVSYLLVTTVPVVLGVLLVKYRAERHISAADLADAGPPTHAMDEKTNAPDTGA